MIQQRDRDAELAELLPKMFEGMSSYSLNSRVHDEPMFTMGGSIQQTNFKMMHQLVVEFRQDMVDHLNAKIAYSPHDPIWDHGLTFGPYARYRPQKLDRTRYKPDARLQEVMVVRVEYYISDIDDFLDNLREEAWRRYDYRMTSLIDGVLSPEDAN